MSAQKEFPMRECRDLKKSENHWCLIILDVVEKSGSESGDYKVRFASFEDEEFHLRDVRWNSYVKGAVVMVGSILPADLSSQHRSSLLACVGVVRCIGSQGEGKREKVCTVHGYIAHVTQMKLKWVTKSRGSREHLIPSRRLLLAFSRIKTGVSALIRGQADESPSVKT